MSRWYERANEASFKAVEGGYVFQSPSPWMFARPRYYLVDEARKAQILIHLGRWRLMMMLVPLISVSIALLPKLSSKTTLLLVPAFVYLGPSLFSLLLFVAVMVLIAPFIAGPQIYLARSLRPLLADAPRTQKRITLAEQLPGIAKSVSGRTLAVGLISASTMIVCGGLSIVAGHFEGDLTRSTVAGASMLIMTGALLVSYFGYLVRVKARMQPCT